MRKKPMKPRGRSKITAVFPATTLASLGLGFKPGDRLPRIRRPGNGFKV